MAESPPDAATLHDAALAYLARYAATRATLLRVLLRRVDRWARTADSEPDETAAHVAAAREAARQIVARLAASGAVDDTAFAQARATRLRRSGRSRRAALAHLAARGVDAATVGTALPDDAAAELAAAIAFARRRRLGPFRAGGPVAPETARREQAAFARAGFTRDATRAALAMALEEAQALLAQSRQP